MSQGRFAGHADGPVADRVDRDVPETGTRCSNSRRESVKRSAVIRMTAAIFEAAKVGVVHQADVAGLGALNDDDVVFVEVLALVDKFHEAPPEGLFLQNQNDSRTIGRVYQPERVIIPLSAPCLTIKNAYSEFYER